MSTNVKLHAPGDGKVTLLHVIGQSHSLYLANFRFLFFSRVPTNMPLQLIRRCGCTAECLDATVAGWVVVNSALRCARNRENGILPGLDCESFGVRPTMSCQVWRPSQPACGSRVWMTGGSIVTRSRLPLDCGHLKK